MSGDNVVAPVERAAAFRNARLLDWVLNSDADLVQERVARFEPHGGPCRRQGSCRAGGATPGVVDVRLFAILVRRFGPCWGVFRRHLHFPTLLPTSSIMLPASPLQPLRQTRNACSSPATRPRSGLKAVYEQLDDKEKAAFRAAYNASYHPCREILEEIYDDVASGNEVRSVIQATRRHGIYPMGKIDSTEMWAVGDKVRADSERNYAPVNPETAGVYLACMMAQVDVLKDHGHPYSEIANESIIEAVDSLNPYMSYKGVSYMVDNCSTTARLGARKWASRFDYILKQQAFPAMGRASVGDGTPFDKFIASDIHEVLAVCAELRPSVDISVVPH
ncbi:hypothetical protein AB8Z38_30070 [Bradyrhizobium sp. LLZ17]|uniref:Ketol-acid reductoisomerase (NADP(+)) n=1 Tax=Bradyrhizobium sp. LLZ17 TaxID=3239388 RepID=A0AB39XFJ7_9BRAD